MGFEIKTTTFIIYTKIHDYNVDYDIVCAHNGGSKFKTLSLVPCSQLLLMHWQIIMHGSAVAYKILFDQIIYLLIIQIVNMIHSRGGVLNPKPNTLDT